MDDPCGITITNSNAPSHPALTMLYSTRETHSPIVPLFMTMWRTGQHVREIASAKTEIARVVIIFSMKLQK